VSSCRAHHHTHTVEGTICQQDLELTGADHQVCLAMHNHPLMVASYHHFHDEVI